ncbi:MAG TPA: DUF2189 domain-containing protein [Steroidobacteraceae bacterium]|nr:DUF2189 domain-containing protein [Steroidobacteraceae bacterium]
MGSSISLSRHHFLHVEIRHVPALRSLQWLSRGWDDLGHMRAASIAHGALITALGAVLLMLGSSHPYLVAAAISGYLLVGPIMTTGLCELSRRRAAQEPAGFDESLQGMTRNPEGLLYFGAVLAAIAIVWFIVSALVLQSVLHTSAPSLGLTLWGGFTDVASRSQILAYIGSGALLAALVFTLSVVAVPLIIDRHATALDAMWISAKAAFWNLPAMLVWAALIVGLTAVGFATFLVGMIIIAPLLGHATWHAYRDLIA